MTSPASGSDIEEGDEVAPSLPALPLLLPPPPVQRPVESEEAALARLLGPVAEWGDADAALAHADAVCGRITALLTQLPSIVVPQLVMAPPPPPRPPSAPLVTSALRAASPPLLPRAASPAGIPVIPQPVTSAPVPAPVTRPAANSYARLHAAKGQGACSATLLHCLLCV